MDNSDWLAECFDGHRGQLRAVAYRMLGSLAEADDAVQETWLRLARADTAALHNLGGWLTTVVARVCLDMLRSRTARREEPLGTHVPDPVVSLDDGPEQAAVLADSVGLALLVVLDTLTPDERLAFVLHDIFAVPFGEIGPILERSPGAAKQLASRARRRLRGAPAPGADLARQRELVGAFLAASRNGDFGALLNLLAPDVVLRADAGDGPFGPSRLIRGSRAVVAQAMNFAHLAKSAQPVLVNGTPGAVAAPRGRVVAVMSVTISGDRIAEINILADPERLRRLGLTALPGPGSDRR